MRDAKIGTMINLHIFFDQYFFVSLLTKVDIEDSQGKIILTKPETGENTRYLQIRSLTLNNQIFGIIIHLN